MKGVDEMYRTNGKRIGVLALSILLLLTLSTISASAAVSVNASRTNASIQVDGATVAFDAYNINGNNYFKLRDIAKVLDGREKQFEVTWNATTNSINLLTDRSYTSVGGELSQASGTSIKSAILSSSKVSINRLQTVLTAYNIDGYNYFKLRDLGNALNFGVAFDSTSNLILIESALGYNAGAVVVTMSGSKFLPGTITIDKGGMVIWKNLDAMGHDVLVNGTNSPILAKGEIFSFTFNTAGTFNYVCTVHPGMAGQIIVVAPTASSNDSTEYNVALR
jgi:plastocyanin